MRWLDRLLFALAALLVVAHLAPLAAKLSWVVELTTHFRVQYLAATVVLLVPLLLRRLHRASAALVLASAISAAVVFPYLPFGVAPASGVGPPIKVLSVNISFGRFSPRRLREIIRAENPDVLIAQELTPYADKELAELDTEFPHRYELPADGAYGIGVWSRLPFEDVKPLALARLPAIQARIRSSHGTFTLLGVHLSAPTSPRRAESRNIELRELARRMAAIEGPALVAGDFNITPYSPYFADFLAATGLTDARRERTMSVSWPTSLSLAGIPIDHVAVNDGFAILSHRRLPDFGSDHYGIVVELALREAAVASESK
jgi:endonuclease/exonuclease/phosphatase (EEP) superfamily protein YafD